MHGLTSVQEQFLVMRFLVTFKQRPLNGFDVSVRPMSNRLLQSRLFGHEIHGKSPGSRQRHMKPEKPVPTASTPIR